MRTALAVGILGGLVIVAVGAFLAGTGGPGSSAPATATAAAAPTASATGTATGTPGPSAPTGSDAPSSSPAGSVVVIGAGDIASCSTSGDTATAKLVEGIAGTVVTLGDNVYDDGTAREFSRCYDPTWGRFRDRTRPAPGNHDYHTAGAAAYFSYFGAAAGDPKRGYYAYDLGTWRVYALNSNCGDIGGCGTGSAEVAWLRADLAAHPSECVLAYWHHPRFSSGLHGSNAFVAGLWDALYAAGAELVLNGHDHSYERFAPQSDAGALDPGRGIVEFVVGTGGFSHYAFPKLLSNSRAHDNTTFGVLELTLSPGSWSSRFVPVAGRSFTDSASGTCH